ncbi:unnamed protein product [Sphagnum troendelagicum]|uniref:FAD-binding domain-containing protein n=1 Tax=Sphagnum jensenii TaxID=128206 RepID=A0ABP0WIA6_9BRYO
MELGGLTGGSPIEERIVIVGGGVGGLACALALHRVGLKAVVLEQAPTLRAEGSALTLWTNAFRVLDILGIGDQLRKDHLSIEANNGILISQDVVYRRMYLMSEGMDTGFGCHRPHELRAIERRILLDALAEQLPPGTIRFNSRVKCITKVDGVQGVTHLELQDGTIYSSKIVVGVDGVNSVVAEWMGLPKAKIVGQVSVRGLAVFPDGQNFKPEVHYYVGKGTRGGVVPISTTKASWFVNWNDWSSGPFKDPKLSKEDSLKHVEGWSLLTPCIENTAIDYITKSALKHRLNSHESSSQVFDGVTLAGDASHPSTPNLGQGACCALEDAIVLAQKLSGALNPNTEILKTDQNSDGNINQMVEDEKLRQRINTALLEFQAERHERTHPLVVQAYNTGMLMQSDWSLVCFLRNWFIIPRINRQTFLQHTLFDVGKLPMIDSKTTEDQ